MNELNSDTCYRSKLSCRLISIAFGLRNQTVSKLSIATTSCSSPPFSYDNIDEEEKDIEEEENGGEQEDEADNIFIVYEDDSDNYSDNDSEKVTYSLQCNQSMRFSSDGCKMWVHQTRQATEMCRDKTRNTAKRKRK